MRIVSLLPSATEIVAALGLADHLVGISHECDYPEQVRDRPRVTRCEIHGSDLPSPAIDAWVRDTLASRGTLYTLDEELIRDLQPDLILTQQLCDVCAVNYGSVAAFAASLPARPRLINLEPKRLTDIYADIRLVAQASNVPHRAEAVIAGLEERVQTVVSLVARVQSRPKCFLMEWIDPPFCGGHWNPELVELAGGADPIGRKGGPSRRVTWEEIQHADPDVVLLACCGFGVRRTLHETSLLAGKAHWESLRAVRQGRVYVADGSTYFSRPGPRIVDSLEMLAHVLHPEAVAATAVPAVPARLQARAEVSVSLGPDLATAKRSA
ncbi:MAG TPA: cobalamin-binding protein [Burkholderiales bacterium]|nr:cobalamin-binding protein [Burkholderiales bacterium]